MSPLVATVLYVLLILGLFWLDRDKKVRTSAALWIPVVWFSISCSRSVTQWLNIGTPVESADQVLDGSPVDRFFYTCLLAIAIAVLATRAQRIGKLLIRNGPILLFFFYCVVSLLWSDFPSVAFKRWTKAIGDLAMILIVLSDREPLAAVQRLIARAGYVLVPLSILFIKYYPTLGVYFGPWGGGTGYVGVTTNKNTLGAVCLFLGLGALWRFLAVCQEPKSDGRTRKMIAQAVFLVLVAWLLYKTNSMTSLSCFLMGSVLLVAANLRVVIRKPLLVHLLVVAMLIAAVMVLFFGVSPGALETMGRNATLTDRTEVWAMLLTLVKNPWLGTGFESFWLGPRLERMWDRYWWHPGEAHNGYLEIFINLGWVGVALLGGVIMTGYRKIFRAWRNNIPISNLCLAYFFVGLVYNFTEAAFFRMLAPAWLFFLFAIVGVSAFSSRKGKLSERSLVQPAGPLVREQLALTSSAAAAGPLWKL